MKVEYEWHAVDECGRIESIAECEPRKPRPWWCWGLLALLGSAIVAALAYGGYVAFS